MNGHRVPLWGGFSRSPNMIHDRLLLLKQILDCVRRPWPPSRSSIDGHARAPVAARVSEKNGLPLVAVQLFLACTAIPMTLIFGGATFLGVPICFICTVFNIIIHLEI